MTDQDAGALAAQSAEAVQRFEAGLLVVGEAGQLALIEIAHRVEAISGEQDFA